MRAMLVHAKDEQARAFYEHFGFEQSPTDNLHLFLLRVGGVFRVLWEQAVAADNRLGDVDNLVLRASSLVA